MRPLVFAALLPAALLAGCEDEAPLPETYTATLSGGAEQPAVTTSASGSATFTVSGNELTYRIDVVMLDEANAAHIHAGAEGQNGGIMVGLFNGPTTIAGFTGRLAEGTVTVADSVIERMRDRAAYVNVHTLGHLLGEIRGEIR